MPRRLVLALVAFFAASRGEATTLPPELKAYDFGEAYYVEDGGVVISPYAHGFYCPEGIPTPEGIRVMPGQAFIQFDAAQKLEQVYQLVRLSNGGARAFFRETIYHYEMGRGQDRKPRLVRTKLLGMDEFYLSRFRSLEPFDHVFTDIELHPGARVWSVSKN